MSDESPTLVRQHEPSSGVRQPPSIPSHRGVTRVSRITELLDAQDSLNRHNTLLKAMVIGGIVHKPVEGNPMSFSDDPSLEPAQLRIAPPGTKMVWRRLDGYAIERGVIGPIAPDLLAHYQWEGEPRSMYFFCINCAGDEVSFDHAAYESLFPLEVGKTVTFRRSVGQWVWINRISVVGTERLSLEFGEVDTYLIACATQGQNNPFHAENDIWYAPSVGWNVQFRYRNSRGESYSWQLVEFIPPH